MKKRLPFQQACRIAVLLSLIRLQTLFYFGSAVKGERLGRVARWTQLQPWILES